MLKYWPIAVGLGCKRWGGKGSGGGAIVFFVWRSFENIGRAFFFHLF